MGSYMKEHWEAMRNPTQLRASKQGSSSPDQPKANVSRCDASCSHAMRSVRRDRASAAGCATTRATTTTRNATPTAMHAVLRICIVDVGSQGQLITVRSSQQQTRATKSNPEKRSGTEDMLSKRHLPIGKEHPRNKISCVCWASNHCQRCCLRFIVSMFVHKADRWSRYVSRT